MDGDYPPGRAAESPDRHRGPHPGPDRLAYAAVVLAGGAGSRLGGAVKPTIRVAGRPMLDRVLAAVASAAARVVVGPPDLAVPGGVLLTREDPPGGGPVAGAAAGLALVPPELRWVALLASDLPLLEPRAIDLLFAALDAGSAADPAAGGPSSDVAVYVDADGRRQSLCGMWRADGLRTALARLAGGPGDRAADGGGPRPTGPRPPLAGSRGLSMRALLRGVRVVEVPWSMAGAPPWFDCDTDADLRRAEEWAVERESEERP